MGTVASFFKRKSFVIVFPVVPLKDTSKWGSGRLDIFFPFLLQCHLLLFNLDQDKWKWIAARLYLFFAVISSVEHARKLPHIVHSPPHAGKGCESQLLYSVKHHLYFWFLNAVLFPVGGLIFNAVAAHSALSRSRTSSRQCGEICSIGPCRFQNCHHCLPLSLSPDGLELSCLPKLLLSIIDVTLTMLTFSATCKLISHRELFPVWRLS